MRPVKKPALPVATRKRQIANKAKWNQERSADAARFFTIGYSGRTLEEMVAVLKEHGVRTLVDIRHDAISVHRPEMSKKNLSRTIEESGMQYLHRPDLGIPREIRTRAAKAGSRDVLWSWYDANVAASLADLRRFFHGMEEPAALMCLELDPQECHRHRLALTLERAGFASFDL